MEVSTEELEYEIGVAFLGRAETEGEVKVKKIPKQMVLSSVFKGRYAKACLIYREIFEYAAKNGYEIIGPVTENYLNSPNEVDEEDLLPKSFFQCLKCN